MYLPAPWNAEKAMDQYAQGTLDSMQIEPIGEARSAAYTGISTI